MRGGLNPPCGIRVYYENMGSADFYWKLVPFCLYRGCNLVDSFWCFWELIYLHRKKVIM